MNSTFQELCKKGNLEEIKQFYFDNPTIDISANNESAFQFACAYGHLEVAKWLLEMKPDIKFLQIMNMLFDMLAVMDS
jgi:ankyrin repeat protein